MQQQNLPVVSSGKIALRYGLIFGLIQAALALITTLITALVDPVGKNSGLILGLDVLIFVTGLAAYFVAGIFASKRTGKVSTGTLGGLWTGVFYGVLGCIISIVAFEVIRYPKLVEYYNAAGYPAGASASTFQLGLVIAGIGLPILGLLGAIGVGTGIGALGGLLGRSIFNRNTPPQPYPAQPYPGQPFPPQPYPPQPYPGQPYPGQPIPPQSYPAQSYPGQPSPYTQPHPGQQAQAPEQPATPSPTEWNPYNSDQPQ